MLLEYADEIIYSHLHVNAWCLQKNKDSPEDIRDLNIDELKDGELEVIEGKFVILKKYSRIGTSYIFWVNRSEVIRQSIWKVSPVSYILISLLIVYLFIIRYSIHRQRLLANIISSLENVSKRNSQKLKVLDDAVEKIIHTLNMEKVKRM